MKNESLFIISYFFRIPSSRMILFLLLNTKMWTHAPQWKCRSKSGGESVFSFHLSKDSRDQTQITRIVWVAPSLQNYLTGSGKTAPFFLNYLLLLLLLCTHTHMHNMNVGTYMPHHVCRPEDSFEELVFPFTFTWLLETQPGLPGLHNEGLYQLSHLSGPWKKVLKM